MSGRTLLVFDAAEPLVAAARHFRDQGVEDMDAHTPYHVEPLDEVLGLGDAGLRMWMLGVGVAAALGIFALQTYSSVWGYPINSGGRPMFAWPAFGFATFEMGILGAAFAGFVALLSLCRLPRPHDPFFRTAETEAASDDRYYLSLPSASAPDRLALSQIDGLAGIIEVPV